MEFGVQFFPDVRPEQKSGVDYFRDARMGEKTLGQVHDDTWGQIEALEARI